MIRWIVHLAAKANLPDDLKSDSSVGGTPTVSTKPDIKVAIASAIRDVKNFREFVETRVCEKIQPTLGTKEAELCDKIQQDAFSAIADLSIPALVDSALGFINAAATIKQQRRELLVTHLGSLKLQPFSDLISQSNPETQSMAN